MATIELSEYVIDAIANAVVKKMKESCEDAINKHPIIECEGKFYVGENLILKTIDKDNICSFYGFREVKEND